MRRRSSSVLIALAFVAACGGEATPPTDPGDDRPTPLPAPTELTVGGSFELLGGYRLDVSYASEGLGLVRDSAGFVVEAISGAHAHEHAVHVFDLRQPPSPGADASGYAVLSPRRTWRVSQLYPNWISGQSLRDVAVVPTANGYELAGVGRVFYNTTPRPTTQINVREITNGGATLGATRVIPVNLPEQEFSGFIKHSDPRDDLSAIGAGAYDSGQGSVAGLSYAVRGSDGLWVRRLTPPGFGDLTTPRLPRDTAYSCPGGASWVCIPPVGGVGVWSTERIGGGGARIGNSLLFIATLGYGDRRYERQSYTFGDPALDRAVAYIFSQDSTGGATPTVRLTRYERWAYAKPGEIVLGVATGRVRNVTGAVLFVVTGNAWSADGRSNASPMLQLFRIK